jgi:hypothetical protein
MREELTGMPRRVGRGLVTVLTAGCLCACAWPAVSERRQGAPEIAADQQLFIRGMEEVAATRSSESLARLAKEFPDSPWAARGRAVARLQEDWRQEQQKVAELQKKGEECSLERAQLQSDVRSLEAYTVRLKALLDEMGGSLPPR